MKLSPELSKFMNVLTVDPPYWPRLTITNDIEALMVAIALLEICQTDDADIPESRYQQVAADVEFFRDRVISQNPDLQPGEVVRFLRRYFNNGRYYNNKPNRKGDSKNA